MEGFQHRLGSWAKKALWVSGLAPALCLLGLTMAPTPVPADQGQAKGQPAGDPPSHGIPAPTKGNGGCVGANPFEPQQDDSWLVSGRSEKRHIVISLHSRQSLRHMLREFPDLSNADSLWIEHVDAGIASVPDRLLKRIAAEGKNLRSLVIDGSDMLRRDKRAEISDAGMELLSTLSNLEQLNLHCRFSADGFAHLSKLKKLRTLGIDGPTFGAQPFFETASKLPDITGLGVGHVDFSQPIDDETFKAVASLNGRLESLSFGEWGETTIHASMIPAIAEIKSLTQLYLGEVKGSLPHPEADYLKTLPYLRDLRPHCKETSEATEVFRLPVDERFPIEFRKAECDWEIEMLLRFLLGSGEAKKVRRKVSLRRCGLSPRPKDYSRRECPLLSTILKRDFDVTLYPNTLEMLPMLTGRYPELDGQLRRYLAGEDFVEEEKPKAEADE